MKQIQPMSGPFMQSLGAVGFSQHKTRAGGVPSAEHLHTARRLGPCFEETCGCVLAIRNRHALPDGGLLDVSEFDYRTAAGVRLEGAGVKPDETSTLSRADIYSRRDRALEIAKDSILKTL